MTVSLSRICLVSGRVITRTKLMMVNYNVATRSSVYFGKKITIYIHIFILFILNNLTIKCVT